MSCVAEAKAVMMNSTRVTVNRLMGVVPAAIAAASGRGNVSASSTNAPAMSSCMATTHHRLVRTMSTNGLQNGLTAQGR